MTSLDVVVDFPGHEKVPARLRDVSIEGMFVEYCADAPGYTAEVGAGAHISIAVQDDEGPFCIEADVVRTIRGVGVGARNAALRGSRRWTNLVGYLAERAGPAGVQRAASPADDTVARAAAAVLDGAARGNPHLALQLQPNATADAVDKQITGLRSMFRDHLQNQNGDIETMARVRAAQVALTTVETLVRSPLQRRSTRSMRVIPDEMLQEQDQKAAQPRILIVDDSATARAVLKVHVTMMKRNFEVIDAGSAAEAMFAIESQPLALAIVDQNMPAIDGLALVKRVRAHERAELRQLPIIVISGDHAQADLPVIAQAAGASAVVFKPSAKLPTGRLTEVIAQLLPEPVQVAPAPAPTPTTPPTTTTATPPAPTTPKPTMPKPASSS